MILRFFFLLLYGGVLTASALSAPCENVFIITLDGMRWQEVFSGADSALFSRDGGISDPARVQKDFGRPTPEERREALLPFFWQVIAKQGQLYGNQNKGSIARVTNGKNFTYPGFNEILTGFADPRIDSNSKIHNQNVTVLEWLHQKPAFTNRVAAFANWDVFPYIMNAGRAGIPIWTGYKEGTLPAINPEMVLINTLAQDITPLWDGMNFDLFFHHASREYVRHRKLRAVWIAYSETDEWAHEGRYDLYLYAAHKIDGYIRGLWETLQTIPEYKDKTAFILTTDHGRGTGPSAWKNHGADVKGAEEIWIAALGAGVPALGERQSVAPVAQNQIASTVAAWLGEDYEKAVPRAGKVITDLLPQPRKVSESSYSIPATDQGLPGAGPIRRYDWFRKLWEQKRSAWANRIEQDQKALVFLGNSITQGWGDNMGGSFPGVKVANRGISGDTTRGALIRLREDVLSLNPSGIVLLIGTNDLEEGADPETIADNLNLILKEIKKHDSKIPIVLCQVFPSSASKKRPADKIKKVNELYAGLVKGDPQITLVDTWSVFANAEGDAKKDEFPDLLHPNKAGYEKWAATLHPILARLGLAK